MVAHRAFFVLTPYHIRLGFCEIGNGFRAAELDTVIFGDGGCEVIVAVRVERAPGIGALFDKGI